MAEPLDTGEPAPPGLAATWQDHPAVRVVLFAGAFACGLVAIDAADPPRADDLRFLWLAAVPFALAFVVRHALWPVAAGIAYQVGAWAPNAAYQRPLPALGEMQPLFPAMTALAGMGILWTVWGFRAGYSSPAPPPVFGQGPVRRLRLRLAAASLVYAVGLAPLLAPPDASWFLPSLAWLALAPFALAPVARARLWPIVAALLAGAAAGIVVAGAWRHAGAYGFSPDGRWPAAGVAAVVAASLVWTTAVAGFVAAGAVDGLLARRRGG